MNVTSYWDSLFIIDDALNENVITKIESTVNKFKDLKAGEVSGCEPDESIYNFHFDANNELDFVFDEIMNLGVVKLADGEKFNVGTRYHKFCVGGKMAWHIDSNYDLAITLYLSECVGGCVEFIRAEDTSQLISINPLRNRLVISNCTLPHSVSEVIEGVRDSIQIFIKFANK